MALRLQNPSLLPTPGPVAVRFYDGDPDAGGVVIRNAAGQDTVFSADAIPARGTALVTSDWVYPAGRPFVRVYAVVDPSNAIPGEIHEDNNKGWNVVAPHAVPEPGSTAVGAAVLATLFGVVRKRRRSPAGGYAPSNASSPASSSTATSSSPARASLLPASAPATT
jgi:hypothetical protein